MTFLDRLTLTCNRQNSLLCVGLDPDLRRLPESVRTSPEPLFEFCATIIESTQAVAAAFKVNFAFFESEGSKGWEQLENLVKIIPANVLKIADAKRADIGSSSEMYAQAILERLDFDAVTVNPYLGKDAIVPFLQWPEKGAFVLCVTSNPGAEDFQHFSDGTKTLFMKVLESVAAWNEKQNCCLVVGATHPNALKVVRAAAPNMPFLVPGLGFQGGDVESAVIHATDDRGGLALFNSSRDIIYHSNGPDFAEAARRQAERLRDRINILRSNKARED